jgi:hypothetical protein
MSQEPIVYQVKPEQVGGKDIMDFLRQQIARNFNNNFEIVNEQTLSKSTSYSKTPRRIVAFLVEAGGQTHSVFFDTTEVSAASNINWIGH